VLNAEGEPTVIVGIADASQDWVPITKSPFTGGDIIVSVDEKSYDAVVAALEAVASQAEEVPEIFVEDEDNANADQDAEGQEDDYEDEDFEDEDVDEDLEDADSEDSDDDEDFEDEDDEEEDD